MNEEIIHTMRETIKKQFDLIKRTDFPMILPCEYIDEIYIRLSLLGFIAILM